MNNKNIFDLTTRLSQALDQNYEVINMDAVRSVISALEGTTITKEQLEATRLAKYINQLRRRTQNKQLARSAKSLLKEWREMVGIQQANDPSSSSVATSDNAIASNLQNHCSQPTFEMNLENAAIASEANARHVDFLRSTASNPAPTVSSLTRSANLNVHYSNKRLEATEGQSRICTSSSVEPTDVGKQPTSFANLISICNDNNMSSSKANVTTVTSPRIARKSNKTYDESDVKLTKTYIIDQSSNSNSEVSYTTSNRTTSVAPVVIDIQDSNSGSNLIVPIVKVPSDTPATLSKVSTLVSSTMSFKTKKAKKDKKRKDRDIHSENSSHRQNTLVIIDETSSNPSHQAMGAKDGKFVTAMEDKSRITYPMSEILSLSNSSMSLIFPNEGASRPVDAQSRTDLATSNRIRSTTALSTSDLTFAGKFKQCSNSVASSGNNSGLYAFNGSDLNRSTIGGTSKAAIAQQTVTDKFVPFSGCNSNESTSNSRTSQFDIIDVVSQDNNQTKIIAELRLKNKQVENSLIEPTVPLLHRVADTAESYAAASVVPEKKIPKKRGRKKGSKGVDSIIAKETSLSSQMLITSLGSGGKKVKTTKELYAEMQNRKLGISATTSSPTLTNWAAQQQLSSRPESSCSELSIHSPRTMDACSTNATMSTVATRSTPDKYFFNANADEVDSDSDTITSEPSHDSPVALKNVCRGIGADSNSYSQFPGANTNESKVLAQTTANIEKRLRELLYQLPPASNVKDFELDCTVETVPCTCKIVEVLPQLDNQPHTVDDSETLMQNQLLAEPIDKTMHETEQQPPILLNLTKHEPNQPEVKDIKSPPPKPKKSIFDLDFDDDEDPLQTFLAEAAAATVKQESLSSRNETVTKADLVLKLEENEAIQPQTTPIKQIVQPPQTLIESMPVFSTLQVEEDQNCIAKNRFEIQTQKITEFHINALHNCYIANINGNWENADTLTVIETDISEFSLNTINNTVVPQYGSLINERILKDLSYVNFTKSFKPKKRSLAMDKHNDTPFLGVAQSLQLRNDRMGHRIFDKGRECQVGNTNVLTNPCSNEIVDNDKELPVNVIGPIGFTENNNKDLIKNEVMVNTICYTSNASNIIGSNSNKNMFKDITIDVTDAHNLDTHKYNTAVDDVEVVKSHHLLAIAEDLNFVNATPAIDNPSLYSEINLNTADVPAPYKTENEKTTSTNNAEGTTIVDISATMPTLTTDISNIVVIQKPEPSATTNYDSLSTSYRPAKLDENNSSRRSSSCSNSSLKQTQQSINLKLRRRRLLHQQQMKTVSAVKTVGKRRRRRSDNINDNCTESESELNDYKKPRIIKRFKIAIDGDFADGRKISLSSSHNSTDDEEYNDNEPDSEDGNDDNDRESMKSAGSRNSTFEIAEYNIVNVNDDIENEDVDAGAIDIADEDIDEPEAYEDDADIEEDDEEDYSGDFHEVVTRDISTPSTGNNHIVLTIKKTPSKTNSPSNSLSAMSPVINTNARTSNTLTTTAQVVSLNLPIVNDTHMREKSIATATVRDNIFESVVTEHAVGHQIKENNDVINPNAHESKLALLDVSNPKLPLHLVRHGFVREPQRRIRSKLKPRNPFNFSDNDSTMFKDNRRSRRKKLHHQLFFPHEIVIVDSGGVKETILNISSCSSSCVEDSEYDYYNSSTEDAGNSGLSVGNVVSIVEATSCNTALSANCSVFPDIDDGNVISCDADDGPSSTDNAMSIDSNKQRLGNDCKDEQQLKKFVVVNSEPSEEESKYLHCSVMPVENNGLLLSFNNIYRSHEQVKADDNVKKADMEAEVTVVDTEHGDDDVYNNTTQYNTQRQAEQLKQQLPNENCDDYNNLYNNNNNINLIKYSNNKSSLENSVSCKVSCKYSGNNSDEKKTAESEGNNLAEIEITENQSNNNNNMNTNTSTTNPLIPHKEYRTGLRAVDEDVDDDDGNNCARIQQFKEWHQVLQLRSYNDELLTVLPYVVLE